MRCLISEDIHSSIPVLVTVWGCDICVLHRVVTVVLVPDVLAPVAPLPPGVLQPHVGTLLPIGAALRRTTLNW